MSAFNTIRYGAYVAAKAAYRDLQRAPVQSRAVRDVLVERERQVAKGFTAAHDDVHGRGEIASAAANYVVAAAICERNGIGGWRGEPRDFPPPLHGAGLGAGIDWPFHASWWKPGRTRRILVKAIAMLIAEVERIDRLSATPQIEAEAVLRIEEAR